MRKVAIVGVEGSGKTVMLAGLGDLYSHPDESGCFLAPKDFQTASYVSAKIARMRKGEWPAATAEDVMQGLGWTLKRRHDVRQRPEDLCEVSCLDFAGEVYRSAFGIRRGQIMTNEVVALKEYIRNADDLIVLINLHDIIVQGVNEPRVQEAMWITNEILSSALDESGGRKAPRAAIVLSQADSYADTIRACNGPRGVLAKYLPHVANNYNWLDIFAASAVDKTVLDDDGNLVPAPDFTTEGLRPIMDWLLSDDGLQKINEPQAQVQQRDAGSPLSTPDVITYRARWFSALVDVSFSGRMSRKVYWIDLLLLLGGTLAVGAMCGTMIMIAGVLLDFEGIQVFLCVVSAFGLALTMIWAFAKLLSLEVRRLHDIGLSGWWLMLSLIPGACSGVFEIAEPAAVLLVLILVSGLVLGFVPGKCVPNKYGIPAGGK